MDISQIMSNEGLQIPISGVSPLRVTTSKVAAVLRFEQCLNRNYAREAPVGVVACRMLLKHACRGLSSHFRVIPIQVSVAIDKLSVSTYAENACIRIATGEIASPTEGLDGCSLSDFFRR